MSKHRTSGRAPLDLFLFARSYLEGGRVKLVAVLVLEALLTSITGVGLLLIVPLLGLLGFGPGGADNPLWRRLSAMLDRVGVSLTLETGLALFAAVIVARALLNWRRETWQVEVEQEYQTRLRNQLYERLARAELYCLQRLRTSEFIQASQGEIRRVQEAANALFQLFAMTLRLVVYFAVALLLSRGMTLFALVCGAIAILLMRPMVTRTHVLSRQQIRVRSSMMSNLTEHIQGLRTARSLGLTPRFLKEYRERSDEAGRVAVRLTRLSALATLVFDIVAVLLLAAMVYVGLTRFSVDPARFVVLLLVFIRIFPSIGQLQQQLQRFASLVPSFTHYLELVDELEQHEESHPAAGERLLMQHAMELRDVTFAYHPRGDAALRHVSLAIPKYAITAVGGQSGAGKSTLIDVVTGLLPPGAGSLVLDGRSLQDGDRIRWRHETALVPQETFLFSGSIRSNLECVRPDATERELWAKLDAVNARSFVESRAGGLDADVGERGTRLSGGERQRLSIARALLREPQLLILDEPTNNLDADSVAALLDTLESLKRSTAILVVSHDERVLQRADRVYRLDGGTLVVSIVDPRTIRPDARQDAPTVAGSQASRA